MRYKRESPYKFTEYIFLTSVPEYLNDIVGPIISYTAILFNIVVIIILFHKTLRTPSSVLMQGLALSDALTALFSYGLEPFLFKSYIRDEYAEHIGKTVIYFPICKLHHYKLIMVDLFHLSSVLLTTALGIQKFVAIKWPIWSYINVKRREMLAVVVVIFAIFVGLHIPKFLVADFRRGEFDANECKIAAKSESLLNYSFIYYSSMTAIFLLLASVIMLFTSIFIIWSLIRERNIQSTSSENLQNIRRRSSRLIAVVTVTFLVIEFPRICMFGIMQLFSEKDSHSSQLLVDPSTQFMISAFVVFKMEVNDIDVLLKLKLVIEITRLLVVIACLSNFIIYVIMSKQIRCVLKSKLGFCKHRHIISEPAVSSCFSVNSM
ncbi:Hypothetical predicted protein [Mytilus galloprovincialis]|uniref:G-protein coupled receptors family 1 profile domain-containing protein n=1 Tax=Mytilus galloprovincialis TaxID=29158 RepID=A0A8B6G520_MYTGA|nr:Hypothetical predicted protein [Mytilus galloprovincialis]